MMFTKYLLNGKSGTICLTEDVGNFTRGGQHREEMILVEKSFL